MNVMLNIPAETGAARTGTSARRSDGGTANDFGALFDEVAKTAPGDGTAQSDGPEETTDTPDDGEAALAPRRGQNRYGSGGMRDATQAAMDKEPGADTADGDSAAPPADGGAAAPSAWRTSDGAEQRGPAQTGTGDDTAASAGDDRSEPATGEAPADPVVHGHAKRTHDKKDDGAVAVDGRAALPQAAMAATAPARAKAEGQPNPDRPGKAGAAPSRQAEAPGTGATTAATLAEAETETATIRTRLSGDGVATGATSAAGARLAQAAKASDGIHTAPKGQSSRGSDAAISVRVTGQERHLAPAGSTVVPGRTPAAGTGDSGSAGSGTATPVADGERVVQVAAGAVVPARAQRENQDGQTAPRAADGERPADAAPARGDRTAVREDRVATANHGQHRSDGQTDSRQGKSPDVASTATHAEAKRPAVAGPANGDGAQAAGTSQPSATAAAPLTTGVASGIVGALDSTKATAAQAAARGVGATGAAAALEPVRTLALSLDVKEHGSVDLRISLKGNTVNIHLKAERAETAATLARDDASLRDLLHRAGYETQQVQVDRREAAQPRAGDGTMSGQQQQAGGMGSGASSGHAAADQRPASAQPRQPAQGGAFPLNDQDTQDAPRQDRYRGPDRLYV